MLIRSFRIGCLAFAFSCLFASASGQTQQDDLKERLAAKVDFDGIDVNTKLRDAVVVLRTSYNIKIVVDAEAFTKAKIKNVEDRGVKLPAAKGILLGTLVEKLARQVEGTSRVQKDHVLIVPKPK